MAVTRARLLELLDTEEPDYAAAAAAAALDSFDVIGAMVQEANDWIAALAASLAAELATDPAAAAGVTPVLQLAVNHASAGVRAAAALGASRVGSAAEAVTNACLNDPDPGVRALAFRGLAVPLPPKTAEAVLALTVDPAPAVRQQAIALAARNPDASLPGELLAEVISYALARLNELSAQALTDVAALVTALGRPAFPDPGGVLNNLLTESRAALELASEHLATNDGKNAAKQLGVAVKAIVDACAMVGGSLIDLLETHIAWGEASGLARQLGFSLAEPQLRIDDDGLLHKLTVADCTLVATPLLRFDTAELSSRLSLGGASPQLSVSLTLNGLECGLAGGMLASILGGASGSFVSDVALGVDTDRGLNLGASASPRLVLPAHPKAGPIDVREVVVELPAGNGREINLCSAIVSELGSSISLNIDGAGLKLQIAPIGAPPLTVELKPPVGMGLAIDAGLVRGGGYLGERMGGFGGALDLRMGPVEVKAVGFLQVDPFSLVMVMSVEFRPPIDLTFGFTLNAVGGVIGIEHRLDVDALQGSLHSGALDHIMFPPDPVAAAPAILNTLQDVFPFDHGAIVIGPMLKLGWGRPISFITAEIGVILSPPDPRIVIVGRLRVGLPAPELPIVDLRATIYGEVTEDQIVIRADLEGSRLAGYSVAGGLGLLLRWGGQGDFAISAGGFNPRFDAPADLRDLQRISIDLSPPVVLTLRAEAYFALTTNSLQLGARVEAGGDLEVADISGHLSFDAIVLYAPHFAFIADADVAFAIHALGRTLAGVQVQLHLDGPAPWRAEGHAEITVFWTCVPIDVGPLSWGEATNPPPEPADPRQLVYDALRNPRAWRALAPPDTDRVVKLKPAPPSQTEGTVHPLGLFEVRQHVVPLEKVVTHVGPNPVPVDRQRVFLGIPEIDGTKAAALSGVDDLFSPGAFLDLTQDEKLSRPSFEPLLAGMRVRPPGEMADFAGSREADLEYETFVCDDDALLHLKARAKLGSLSPQAMRLALSRGAAGRCELRARDRYAQSPDPIQLAHPSEVTVISKVTAAAIDPADWTTYSMASERDLAVGTQLARLGVT